MPASAVAREHAVVDDHGLESAPFRLSAVRGLLLPIDMEHISRDELRAMMDRGDDFALVEVLARANYRKFHLPGAINVPLAEDFDEEIQKAIPDKSKPIVVYCSDIECSASPTAAKKLDELGYQKVYDYAEGKLDWKEASLPVEGEGTLEESAAPA